MDEINWISMFLATTTPLVIGFVYFNKAVFGNAWMKSLGMTEERPTAGKKLLFLFLAIVFSFFLSFLLLNFNNSGINQEGDFDTFKHGAWHGIFIAITVVAPVLAINGFFGKKSLKNMLISLGYWIITLALMGGILDAMNHWENIVIP